MEKRKLTRVEITQRQRERAKILKKHASEAGFEPVQVWLRHEVKEALDKLVEMNAQFDQNDLIDAALTWVLREDHGLNVPLPVNEIDPENDLFRIGAYITNRSGKRLGWRRFGDAKLHAEVETLEVQGGASDRAKQLLQILESAKQS